MIPVVGVVADFHMGSFHAPIRPMVIQHVPEWETSMALSVASSNKNIDETRKIISKIEKNGNRFIRNPTSTLIFLMNLLDGCLKKMNSLHG
jgi:hypothetical protein